MEKTKIAVIIPVFNEENNILPLTRELISVLKRLNTSYVVYFVNDGSTDGTGKKINEVCRKFTHVVGVHLYPHVGKASALRAGFDLANEHVIITMDGDLQDDPKEIPHLISKLKEGYDLVVGWKQNRQDPMMKVLSSKFFNAIASKLIQTTLHDMDSGFKAFRPIVAKNLVIYGQLHRYIPVLAAARGFRVTEIPVHHRKRQSGISKYGLGRYYSGALDFLTILFHAHYRTRPLHLFGFIGLPVFGVGTISLLYLIVRKFMFHESIGDRPLLLLSVMLIIISVQIGITGLIAEQLARNRYQDRPGYIVDAIVRGKKTKRPR